jgi:hypothetical protein
MRIVATLPGWVNGRSWTKQEQAELSEMKARGVCALCRRPTTRLVYEHDHGVGYHGGRGLTCQSCNAGHMAGVDAGRFAIDIPTRHYLMRPWHLARLGKALPYDPRVRLAVADLDAHDRHELDRISEGDRNPEYAIERLKPEFGHPKLRAPLSHRDVRPILRLCLMNRRGLLTHDIAEIGDRVSAFQQFHLKRVLADHAIDWAVDAAEVLRLRRSDIAADAA